MAVILGSDPMPRRFRSRHRCWVVLAALAALAGCGGRPRLEILPSRLQVDIATMPGLIRVAAHVRGKHGELLSHPITWSVLSGMGITWYPTSDPNIISIKVDGNAQVGRPVELTATANSGKYSSVAVVSFVKSDALSSDRALANHQDDGFPSVALVGGTLGGCVRDSVFPFVHAGELGDWTADACAPPLRPAAVFAQDRTPLFKDPWDHPAPPPAYDELNAVIVTIPPQDTDPNPPPRPPTFKTVTLRAWKLTNAAGDVAARFERERQVANSRYAESLTGIAFVSAGVVQTIPEEVRNCEQLRDLVDFYHPDNNALNIYFAKELARSKRGVWCGGPDGSGANYPGNLILIAMNHGLSNTLAHEIGHALALMEPWDISGHADEIEGMTHDNLMSSGMDDAGTGGRWRFSVGQVFRMHFDRRSWLQGALDCGCDPYARRVCPRLSADVTPLEDRNARLRPGTCP